MWGTAKKRKGSEAKGRVTKKTPVKRSKQAKSKATKSSVTPQKEQTAYEKLYAKWAAMKDKDNTARDKNSNSKEGNTSKTNSPRVTNANFIEEDNFVDMEITDDQNKEFPHSSEDEASTDSEEGEICDEVTDSNNNATMVQTGLTGAHRSPGAGSCHSISRSHEVLGICNDDITPAAEPSGKMDKLEQTVALMQSFLVKKGIINDSMNEKELQEFLTTEGDDPATQNAAKEGGKRNEINRE